MGEDFPSCACPVLIGNRQARHWHRILLSIIFPTALKYLWKIFLHDLLDLFSHHLATQLCLVTLKYYKCAHDLVYILLCVDKNLFISTLDSSNREERSNEVSEEREVSISSLIPAPLSYCIPMGTTERVSLEHASSVQYPPNQPSAPTPPRRKTA